MIAINEHYVNDTGECVESDVAREADSEEKKMNWCTIHYIQTSRRRPRNNFLLLSKLSK